VAGDKDAEDSEAADAASRASAPNRRSEAARGAAAIVWLAGLPLWVWVRFGPLGFNPTDDGFIVSQARRVLHGAVPHADLISPRPLGSAYLHIIDLLLPLPLYDATRLTSALEMQLVAVLFAWLVFRRPPWRWSAVEALTAGSSYLLNLHTFPLMPWHTVDGLLCLAAGLVLLDTALRSGRRWHLAAAFVIFGAAPIMKQSFVVVPLMGLAWLAWARRRQLQLLFHDLVLAVPAAAVLPVAYVAYVAAGGGLDDLVEQLHQSSRLPHWPPLEYFTSGPTHGAERHRLLEVMALIAVVIALSGVIEVVARRALRARRDEWAAAARLVGLAARLTAVVVLLGVALSRKMIYGAPSGSIVMWTLLTTVVIGSMISRRLDGRGLAVFLAALMSTISWGYAVPNLVTGSMVLVMADRLMRGALPDRALRRPVFAGAAVVLAGVVAGVTVGRITDGRDDIVYFDRPRPELVTALRPVDRNMGRVRSTPTTLRYLVDIRECVRRYPATRVAVLPDNPGVYAVFDLHNPFSADWMLNAEMVGMKDRLMKEGRRVDREGDYLVMFQTFSAFRLQSHAADPDATVQTPLYWGDFGVEALQRQLTGTRVACGLFVAFYKPKA
jgi:hypothetical protein